MTFNKHLKVLDNGMTSHDDHSLQLCCPCLCPCLPPCLLDHDMARLCEDPWNDLEIEISWHLYISTLFWLSCMGFLPPLDNALSSTLISCLGLEPIFHWHAKTMTLYEIRLLSLAIIRDTVSVKMLCNAMSMNESDRVKRRTPAANFIWFGETSWQWDFSFKALQCVYMQFSLRRFNNQQMHCESNGKCTAAAAAQLKWMKWLETQIKHSLAPVTLLMFLKSVSE